MTDLTAVAGESVFWALLSDVAKERKAACDAELLDAMGGSGTLTLEAVANGSVVGKVSRVRGKTVLTVASESKLLAFVAEHYPSEIERVVNPAFRKRLLDELQIVDGNVVDGSGVVLDDGIIEPRTKSDYVRVTKSDDAMLVVRGLLAHGRVSVDGLVTRELDE